MAKNLEQIQAGSERNYLEAILGFDGTALMFASGYKLTIKVARTELTQDYPHGFRYTLNLLGPDATAASVVRVLAADNAHAPDDRKHPHDHWHATKFGSAGTTPIDVKKGKYKEVNSIEKLIGDFIRASQKLLSKAGVATEVVAMSTPQKTRPRAAQDNEGPTR